MSERVIADPPPAPERVQKRQERRRGLLLGVSPRAALVGIAVAAIAPTGTVVSVERKSPIADRPSSDTVT